MMSWTNSGFNVYCGNTIWPDDEKGIENIARYIVRAAFSNERMKYILKNQSQEGLIPVQLEVNQEDASYTLIVSDDGIGAFGRGIWRCRDTRFEVGI